jgi:hypothetical protein
MLNKTNIFSKGWLAFELNVLRRLKFQSVAIPYTNDTSLAVNLKRWNVKVESNDFLTCSWTNAIANIQNNNERLSESEVEMLLEDVYVPHFRLKNETLRNWFNETDAWWFDNLRNNVEKLESPTARAIALSVGMNVGDYAMSFSDKTIELRQSFSSVFRKLLNTNYSPINNGQINGCSNKLAIDFLAENYSELMMLRLPSASILSTRDSIGNFAWREEWIRGNNLFWSELETLQTGRLGSKITSRTQYIKFVEELLATASHIPNWAIAHVDNGFISTQDIVETINKIRKVDTIYTKDFSELMGIKAVMITA